MIYWQSFLSIPKCIRKRKEWDVYEPIVDLLSSEEVDALEAKEERNARWTNTVVRGKVYVPPSLVCTFS